jgi:hypothetical protein
VITAFSNPSSVLFRKSVSFPVTKKFLPKNLFENICGLKERFISEFCSMSSAAEYPAQAMAAEWAWRSSKLEVA